MSNLINNINLWRLERMMIKAIRLDEKIESLGTKIERWEKLNINFDNNQTK
jgi:hypothetical protein